MNQVIQHSDALGELTIPILRSSARNKGWKRCASLRPGDWVERDYDHPEYSYRLLVTINGTRTGRICLRDPWGEEESITHQALGEFCRYVGHGQRRWWIRGFLRRFWCEYSQP